LKNNGKSCDAEIFTNSVISENTVFRHSIYDKSIKRNLFDKEYKELLKDNPNNHSGNAGPQNYY
jgi:hypothetical protein